MHPQRYLNNFQLRHKHTLAQPFLCVMREKHGTSYFHCASIDDLLTVSLTVLAERHECGLYDVIPAPDWTPLTQAQIAAIPAGPVRDFAQANFKEHQSDRATHEESVRLHARVTQAIQQADGATALWVLEQRHEYEYESFEITAYDNPSQTT